MAGNVKFVPPRVPLVDLRSGQITREWYLLFASLFEGSGGSGTTPDPVEDQQSTLFVPLDNRTDALAQEIVETPGQSLAPQLGALEQSQAIVIPPPDYRAQLDEISALIAANPAPDLHARLDELELLVAGLPVTQSGIVLASGTYTPTAGNISNVSSATGQVCQYLRVGNTCVVSGTVTVATTAAGLTQVSISLPFASSITLVEQVSGNGNSPNANQTASIRGNGGGFAHMTYSALGTSSVQMLFDFTYRIV